MKDESVRREVGKAKDESTTTLLLDDLMKTTCVNYVYIYIYIYYIYFKYMYSSIYYERKRKLFFFFTREEVQMLRIILFLSHHKQFHDINANKHTSTPRSIISPYYTIVRTKLYVLYKTLCAQNTFVI